MAKHIIKSLSMFIFLIIVDRLIVELYGISMSYIAMEQMSLSSTPVTITIVRYLYSYKFVLELVLFLSTCANDIVEMVRKVTNKDGDRN